MRSTYDSVKKAFLDINRTLANHGQQIPHAMAHDLYATAATLHSTLRDLRTHEAFRPHLDHDPGFRGMVFELLTLCAIHGGDGVSRNHIDHTFHLDDEQTAELLAELCAENLLERREQPEESYALTGKGTGFLLDCEY